MRIIRARLLYTALFALFASACSAEDYETLRNDMVNEVEAMFRDTSGYTDLAGVDPKVKSALKTVPRHEFVPDSMQRNAYLNRPLPIGHSQTISQPYIVALMTDLAEVDEDSVVLEVGTGSGYQAAVLAEIVRHVYTIEIIPELGQTAAEVLKRLDYDNVTTRIGDGYNGWPEEAPFDAILVTAAPDEVPQPLLDQLKTGGRLVIPVGPVGRVQSLRVVRKLEDGEFESRDVLPVGFVPLTRDRE
ncbi:MAG: protein-L-isoaspartate(D-aspartate) O-methyltransferase [Gammaproteobacteria bacterium]